MFRFDQNDSLVILCLCIFSLALDSLVTGNGQPEVTLNSARIFGIQYMVHNRTVSAFLGIPYAVPPTGQLRETGCRWLRLLCPCCSGCRFKKTVTLSTLPSVVNASRHKPACYSVYPADDQSEDCLYLNVWVPEKATPPLAVLIWVHGGGFITGSSAKPEGDLLAGENDVIVVSMNYRLGPFGFLSTLDAASPGNYGLWDQKTALQWVQENIAYFGGDPARVTVMGLSAGAKSISFQVISPHSGLLFQRAILQSGTVYCPTAIQWKPRETALRLGRAVGCEPSTHDGLVDCLRQKPARLIASVADKLWEEDAVRKLIDFGWAPVEDEDFVARLYEKNGTITPLTPTFTGSLMLGINNNEGSILKTWRISAAAKIDPEIETKLLNPEFFKTEFLPKVMAQMFKTLPEKQPIFSTAADVVSYLRADVGSRISAIRKSDLYRILGYQAYVSPTFQFLNQWLRARPKPRFETFLYVFDNYPEVPADEGLEGMKHGDDVLYTFGLVERKLRALNVSEDTITKETNLGWNFRKLLTNFAKSGKYHSPQKLPRWPTWPLYDAEAQGYLALSSTRPRAAHHFRSEDVSFWTRFLPALVIATGSQSSSQQEHARMCHNKVSNISAGSLCSYNGIVSSFSLITACVFLFTR